MTATRREYMATSTIKVNEYVGKSYTDNRLTTFANMKVSGGQTLTINVSNVFRAVLICCTGYQTKGNGLYSIFTNSNGNGGHASLVSADGITVTDGTNKITVSNSTTYITNVNLLILAGDVTGVSTS